MNNSEVTRVLTHVQASSYPERNRRCEQVCRADMPDRYAGATASPIPLHMQVTSNIELTHFNAHITNYAPHRDQSRINNPGLFKVGPKYFVSGGKSKSWCQSISKQEILRAKRDQYIPSSSETNNAVILHSHLTGLWSRLVIKYKGIRAASHSFPEIIKVLPPNKIFHPPNSLTNQPTAIMQFKSILIVSLVGAAAAAPTANSKLDAVVNTRFGAYENEARDASPENAVVNTRFGAYENEARDASSEEAVVNTRFGAYENEAREAATENAVVNTRFGTYENEA